MKRVTAALFAVLLSSCWQTGGQKAPEFTEQRAEVEETIVRLERISVAVDGELGSLRDLSGRFFSAPDSTWEPPFPIDDFKHSAVACLNAPYNESLPDPAVEEVANRLDVTCAVAPLLSLEERIQAVPAKRISVLEHLDLIDQLRSGRAKLQTRLRQLPSIVRRTRAYLGTRRAEVRQVSQDLRTRRNEYSRDSLQKTLATLDDYEQRLQVLDDRLSQLQDREAAWSSELANLVEQLYKGLSRLGPR